MSRMQKILDKAEREGSLRRFTSSSTAVAEPLVESPLEPIAPPMSAPGSAVATPSARVSAPFDPLPSPSMAPSRAVSAKLDVRLVAASAPHSTAAEQYRALRTRLAHSDGPGNNAVMLITSPSPRDGKSLTAANLALAMAQDYQRRVCIVDANLRAPKQHQLFGLAAEPGLSDILEGRAALDDALVTIPDHRITVLPAGTVPAHPAELLGTSAMRRILDTLRSRFDSIIVDAPGAAPLADVGVLAPIVDGIVVVVRAGVTAKPAIHDTIAGLNGHVLGVVLNDTV